MTTQTEALKLAYEELKHIKAWCLRRTGIGLVDENVLAKVEEALANHIEDNLTMVAQPEQEPVAWIEHHKGGDNLNWEEVNHPYAKATPLYTTPPQRTWVGLTDEDRQRAFESMPDMLDGFLKTWGWLHFAKAIEEISKEKNL